MIFTIFRPKRIKNGKPCVARSYRGRYRLDGQDKIVDVALYTTDKRVARQRLEQIVKEKQLEGTGALPPESFRSAAKSPLVEHLEAHLADLHAIGRDKQYLHDVKSRIERLIRECRWERISDVTPAAFQQWRASQTCAPKTLNEYLKSIRGFFNWMLKRELIGRNPLQAVELIKTHGKQRRPRRAFTKEELPRLLGVAGKYRPAYVTAVFTGLRRGELAAVEWADVHLDVLKPYLYARASITKNDKDASIALHPDVVAELRALKALEPREPQEKVFHKLLPSMRVFRGHLKAAGIDFVDSRGYKVDFHSLRHTLATNLSLSGVAPRIAMEIMRHCDIRLTMQTYTDASQLPAADAIATLPSIASVPEGDSQGASQNSPPACPDEVGMGRENAFFEDTEHIENEVIEWSQLIPDRSGPDNAQLECKRAGSLCSPCTPIPSPTSETGPRPRAV